MTTDMLRIQRLPHYGSLPRPRYESAGAAGLDLRAAISEVVAIPPGEMRVIPCGICVEIPEGYVGDVRGRGGLAAKHMITVMHGVGTVDSDYRGEVMVPLMNHNTAFVKRASTMLQEGWWYKVKPGERIAQLVLLPIWKPRMIVEADELSSTDRGAGCLGSTGST